MPEADDVDRLRSAIDAHERFVAEHGHRSANEFLAEHESLRDLLEPLFAHARSAPSADLTGARVLGDFRLLRELGRGGMGIVYDAEQISLGRRVAVKVLPARLALDPERRARFARESRLAASLDHPGIAKIISADADDDVVWFAMERIDGVPLDRVLSRIADTAAASMTGGRLEAAVDEVARQQPHRADETRGTTAAAGSASTVWRSDHVDTVLRIGVQIAAALHHAHQRGVIHRDVKPANVLLRRDGSAVLTDFGLARELDAPSLTLHGDFLGTLSYSAPEQLSGDRATIDHRADVFALGVTLYELLTHRRPFEASTTDEVRARILTVEPRRPRRLNPRIPADLNAVLLKALEKDPAHRYQTAAAMAEDLLAVAEGRSVRARPTRLQTRAWRWCWRNPWPATALTLLLGLVLVLLGIAVVFDRMRAEQELRAGVSLIRAQDFRGAWAALMPLERTSADAPTRAALGELFRRYPCLASHSLVTAPDERVGGAVFSAGGRWLVTSHERWTVPENERWSLRLWAVPTPESPTLQELWRSERAAGAMHLVHVGTGPTIAWTEGKQTAFIGGPQRATSRIEFSERIRGLFPASVPRRFGVQLQSSIQLCSVDGNVERQWPWPDQPFARKWILGDALIAMQQSATGWNVTHIAAPPALPAKLADSRTWPWVDFDPEDPKRMVVTTDDWVTAWRLEAGVLLPSPGRRNPLPGWALSNLSLGDVLGEASRLQRLSELPLRRPEVSWARVFESGAGRWHQPYVVAIEARTLRVWGMPEPFELDPRPGGLELARFEPTGRRLWAISGAATFAAWTFDADTAGSLVETDLPSSVTDALAQSEAREFPGLACGSGRAMLACARTRDGSSDPPGWIIVVPLDEPERAVAHRCQSTPHWLELSPDRRRLAVAENNGGVELWTYDEDRPHLTDPVALPPLAVGAIRLSCVRYLDDRFLLAAAGASASSGGILRWDLRAPGARPVSVAPYEARAPVRCLAVSADGRLVAAGGDDRLVRVMRVVTSAGQPRLALAWEHNLGAAVFAVAFAERDATLILASADRDGGIRLWDAETGDDLGIVRDPAGTEERMILSLDFSPNARRLAAVQRDGRILLWDMDRPRRCLEGNRDCAEQLLRLQAEAR